MLLSCSNKALTLTLRQNIFINIYKYYINIYIFTAMCKDVDVQSASVKHKAGM